MLDEGIEVCLNDDIDPCGMECALDFLLKLEGQVFLMCNALLSLHIDREEPFLHTDIQNGRT